MKRYFVDALCIYGNYKYLGIIMLWGLLNALALDVYGTVDWVYYVRLSPFVRMWPVQMYFVLIRNILLVIKYNWWLFRARIGADKCEPVSMTIGTAPTFCTFT